jgi:hypothetical protein
MTTMPLCSATMATGSVGPMAPLQVICGASGGGPPAGGRMSNVPRAGVGDEPGEDAAVGEDDVVMVDDELGVADARDEVEPQAEQAMENPTRVATAARFMFVSTYAAVGRF